LFSYSELGVPFATAVTNITQVDALVQQYTPNINQQLPDFATYAYTEPFLTSTDYGTPLAAGAYGEVTLTTQSMAVIPLTATFVVRPQRNFSNISSTDTFALIHKVEIGFMNKSGILGTATAEDIYNMSVENGVNYSWTAWRRYRGSVVPFKFGKDIPLLQNMAPGVSNQSNFTIKVYFQNISAYTQSFTLDMLTMTEGIITMGKGRIPSKSVGILSKEDVEASWAQAPIPMSRSRNVYGNGFSGSGGFWDNVGTFFKRVLGTAASAAARPALGMATSLLPGVAGQVLNSVGDSVLKNYGMGLQGMGKMRGGQILQVEEMKRLG